MAPPNGIDEFWAKVDKRGPDDCWTWAGGRDEAGYGIFYIRGKRTRAHRWLLGHLRGRPLTREVVGLEDGCHRCDNPPCCNPAHLYVGTRKQNIADAVERSRLWQLRRERCPRGHEYTYRDGGKRRTCRQCEKESDSRTIRRTHCKSGHPLSGDNVLPCKNGKRKCRTCLAAKTGPRGDTCRAGLHPLTGDNLMTDEAGKKRRCRACKTAGDAARYLARKARAA